MNRIKVAQELVLLAKSLISMDFPTEEAMKKYLEEHPGADRTLHRVKETRKDDEKKSVPKIKKFSESTDAFFDDASDSKTHDESVKEMKTLIEQDGTKENLDKLEELAKKTKASWGKKVLDTIHEIKNGTFKNEFKNTYGGKPGKNNISQVSELFFHLGQALNY